MNRSQRLMVVLATTALVVSAVSEAQVRGSRGRPGNPNGPGQPPGGRRVEPSRPSPRTPHVYVPGGGPVGSPGNPGPIFRPQPSRPPVYRPNRPPVIHVPGGGPVGTYRRDGRWGGIDGRYSCDYVYGCGYYAYRGGPRVRSDWSIYGDRYYRRRNQQWYIAIRAKYEWDSAVEYLDTISPDYADSADYATTKTIYNVESGVKSIFFAVEDGNVEIDYVQINFADGGAPEFIDFNELYSDSRTFMAGESYSIDLQGWQRVVSSIEMRAYHDAYNGDVDVHFFADRR